MSWSLVVLQIPAEKNVSHPSQSAGADQIKMSNPSNSD